MNMCIVEGRPSEIFWPEAQWHSRPESRKNMRKEKRDTLSLEFIISNSAFEVRRIRTFLPSCIVYTSSTPRPTLKHCIYLPQFIFARFQDSNPFQPHFQWCRSVGVWRAMGDHLLPPPHPKQGRKKMA